MNWRILICLAEVCLAKDLPEGIGILLSRLRKVLKKVLFSFEIKGPCMKK